MTLLKHLPQIRWPFRSMADRYAKDYLAEERSGSGEVEAKSGAVYVDEELRERLQDCWKELPIQERLNDLEQRVSALEEGQEDLEQGAHDLMLTHVRAWHSTATPSPATESPTTDSPSDAAEQVYTIPGHQPFSLSDPRTINAGPAGHDSGSADLSAAST